MSCKKSRARCHCSPVYNLVGLAGFAMFFSKRWVFLLHPAPLEKDENGCILSFVFQNDCFDKPDII